MKLNDYIQIIFTKFGFLSVEETTKLVILSLVFLTIIIILIFSFLYIYRKIVGEKGNVVDKEKIIKNKELEGFKESTKSSADSSNNAHLKNN